MEFGCTGNGTSRRPLPACIKLDAADFVVVEVDPNGVAVPETVGEGYTHFPLEAPEASKKKNNGGERRGPAERLPLQEAMSLAWGDGGEEKLKLVTDFVESLGDSAGKDQKLVLGTLDDKSTRGVVRVSIRYAHPRVTTDLEDDKLVVVPWAEYPLFARSVGVRGAEVLCRARISAPESGNIQLEFTPSVTKDERKDFYEALRRFLPSAKCRTVGTSLQLRISPPKVGNKRNADEANNEVSVFTHFVAQKENVDVFELKSVIARRLRVAEDAVVTAGIKDKRAITFQRCSVRGDFTEAIGAAGISIPLPGTSDMTRMVALHHAELQPAPLRMGLLQGNVFRIAVRSLPEDAPNLEEDLEQRLSSVRDLGFANYFGPQRFGSPSGLQRHTGVHAVAGRFSSAIGCMLDVTSPTDSSLTAKITFKNDRDVEGALRLVPPRNRDLHLILGNLKKILKEMKCSSASQLSDPEWEEVCRKAVMALPYSIRQLWAHSAQSLVFNLAVSELSKIAETTRLFVKNSADGSVVLADNVKQPASAVLPLIGRDNAEAISESFGGNAGAPAALRGALEQLQIRVEDFAGNPLGVDLSGGWRPMFVQPTDMSWTFAAASRSLEVSFTLPSSAYASCLLLSVLGEFPRTGTADDALDA